MDKNISVMLSVVVPVYNVEETLDRCVDSILKQGVDNMEIILVDDGSLDGSPALCDAWSKRNERIKVIHKSNGGLSDARNAGIEQARGGYVTFVDSDDYITESMLEKLIFEMSNDIDLVVSSIKMVGNKSEKEFIMPNCVLSAEDYVSMYCESISPFSSVRASFKISFVISNS